MVGYPGSGKSTIANTFNSKRYKIISGDEYVTSKKMIKASEEYLKNGSSIIYDSTNPTIIKRKEYIDVAKKYNIQVRCVDIKTDIVESMFRNNKRAKVIPKITYYVFRKKYQEPTVSEGFAEVITIS
jgi:bifunctional polynucleotide phosphatase/kinase